MNRLAHGFDAHRRLVAGAVIALTLIAAFGLTQVRFDQNLRELFRSRGLDELDEVYRQFGTDDHDCMVILQADQAIAPQPVRVMRSIITSVREIEGISAVFSLDDALGARPGSLIPQPLVPPPDAAPEVWNSARAELVSHPVVGGRMISADGRTMLIIIRLGGDVVAANDLAPLTKAIDEAARSAAAGTDVEVIITGVPVVRVALVQMLKREEITFLGVSGLLGSFMALLLLRRLVAVLVVTVASWTGALWTVGALGLVGEPLNAINSVVPTIVLVVAFADAVHLVFEMRRLRATGLEPRAASVGALVSIGPACALTSLTTAIGFASLLAARMVVIERFGVAAAGGAILSFLGVITVVPLLAGTRLGRHIGTTDVATGADLGRLKPLLIDPILRYPRLLSLVGIGLTIVCVAMTTRLRPDSWLRETIPTGTDVYRGVEVCDEAFGGLLWLLVLVDWDEDLTIGSPELLDTLARVEAVLRADPMTSDPLSVLNVLRALPGPPGAAPSKAAMLEHVPPEVLGRLLRVDHRRTLVISGMPDIGLASLTPSLERIEAEVRRIDDATPGVGLALSGMPIGIGRTTGRMIADLARSLGMASLVIFGVMTLALRSVRLGLISVVPNVLPIAAAGTMLVLIDYPLTVTGVIAFCVCLGIAVDDTIHVLMGFRRHRRSGADAHAALERTIVTVGAPLLTTTAVLVAGMSVLLLSQMPVMRLFGGICTVALAAALLADLTILPGLLEWAYQGRRSRTHRAGTASR